MTKIIIATILAAAALLATPDDSASHNAALVRTIIIDPGHGGDHPGAIGPTGLMEKEVVLAVARKLQRLIESDDALGRSGVKALLTRDTDMFLTLEDRAAMANSSGGNVFISIHTNSSHALGARGAETYILSLTASDEHARKVAEVENQAHGEESLAADESDDVKMILFDVIQKKYIEESKFLAEHIQEEFNASLNLRNRGVKQAPFRVLKGVAMPAVLVEIDYIDNRENELRLKDETYQWQIARSLLSAIRQYKERKERGYASPSSRNNNGPTQ